MKILFIANTGWYLFNFRLNLMKFLKFKGHHIFILAPDNIYIKDFLNEGFLYENFNLQADGINPFKELSSIIEIYKSVKFFQPDLVISFTPKTNIYSALASIFLGIKFIPGVSGLGRSFINKNLITLIVFTLYKFTFNKAFEVFFENVDDKNLFLNNGLIKKSSGICVPGAGIDLKRFSSNLIERKKINNNIIFLLIGRMLWDKGVGEYISAARKVKHFFPHVKFQLLGFLEVSNPSAISKDQISSWVDEGIVDYLGHTDDVRPFILNADCIVLPSYREGLPRTLLEAAALNRVVITTDAPGCRDTVIHSQTGYLCNVADIDDLSDKMISFINLDYAERLKMGTEARKFIEDNFDENFVFNKYFDVINKI
jgi:glycosyltransferase involved in cell wall biosynthesis